MGRNVQDVFDLSDDITKALENSLALMTRNMTKKFNAEISVAAKSIFLKSVGFETASFTNKKGNDNKVFTEQKKHESEIFNLRKAHEKQIANDNKLATRQLLSTMKVSENLLRGQILSLGGAYGNGGARHKNNDKAMRSIYGILKDNVSHQAGYYKDLGGISAKEMLGDNYEGLDALREDITSRNTRLFEIERKKSNTEDLSEIALLNSEYTSSSAKVDGMQEVFDKATEDKKESSAEKEESRNKSQLVDIAPKSVMALAIAVGVIAVGGVYKLGQSGQNTTNASFAYESMGIDPQYGLKLDNAYKASGYDTSVADLISAMRTENPIAGLSELSSLSKRLNETPNQETRVKIAEAFGLSGDQIVGAMKFNSMSARANSMQDIDLAKQKEVSEAFTELQTELNNLSNTLKDGLAPAVTESIRALTNLTTYLNDRVFSDGYMEDVKTVASGSWDYAKERNALVYSIDKMYDVFSKDGDIKANYTPTAGGKPSDMFGGNNNYYNMSGVTVIANNPEEFNNEIKNLTNQKRQGEQQ